MILRLELQHYNNESMIMIILYVNVIIPFIIKYRQCYEKSSEKEQLHI